MASTGSPYKRILYEIANNLTFSDVGSLKFVCCGLIETGPLDRVPNDEPLKLFKLLEDRQYIREGNLIWLRDILKKIQRIDLVRKIPDEFCQSAQRDFADGGDMVAAGSTSGGMVSPSPIGAGSVSPYRMLLKEVADELTGDNVSKMKFFLDVPDGIGERLQNSQTLITHMEHDGKLSEGNLTELQNLLENISRIDLRNKVKNFNISQPPPQPATPFTRDPSYCYTMKKPYGFALIINNHEFKGTTTDGFPLDQRTGSEIDLENLVKLWKQLGFVAEKRQNLKAHEIWTVVTDIKKKINEKRDSSCFVCCIMTHGAMGKIYGSDSKHVYIKDIIDLFKEGNCPALAGKPRLFFIQACRANPNSNEQQTDAHPVPGQDEEGNANDAAFRHNADPNDPHFLLGYSTAPGSESLRNIQEGTFYVNALTSVFEKHHKEEDVLHMMTRVNQIVDNAGYQQCPAPVFTLAKKVYFD